MLTELKPQDALRLTNATSELVRVLSDLGVVGPDGAIVNVAPDGEETPPPEDRAADAGRPPERASAPAADSEENPFADAVGVSDAQKDARPADPVASAAEINNVIRVATTAAQHGSHVQLLGLVRNAEGLVRSFMGLPRLLG